MTIPQPGGWYLTTDGIHERWWDGATWSDHTRRVDGAPEFPPSIIDPSVPQAPVVVARRPMGCAGFFWIVAAILLVVVIVVNLPGVKGDAPSGAGDSRVVPEPGRAPLRVLYEVEGTASGASLTFATNDGSEQTKTNIPLINTKGTAGVEFTATSGQFLYLSAQNLGEAGTVTCRISVDGVTVSENTSSGSYSIASCDGSAP
jgi:hypothetical protein